MSIETCKAQTVTVGPTGRSTPALASAAGEDESRASRGLPAQTKVMMVDDEKLNSFVVAEYLKADGYRDLVYTADPCEALAIALRVRPDVILLDLQMPKLSGFEILRQLRAQHALSRTVIAILTASTCAQEKWRAMELGADGFLHKPIERGELLSGLRNILAAQTRID